MHDSPIAHQSRQESKSLNDSEGCRVVMYWRLRVVVSQCVTAMERALRDTPSRYPGSVAWSSDNLLAVGQERSVVVLVRLLRVCGLRSGVDLRRTAVFLVHRPPSPRTLLLFPHSCATTRRAAPPDARSRAAPAREVRHVSLTHSPRSPPSPASPFRRDALPSVFPFVPSSQNPADVTGPVGCIFLADDTVPVTDDTSADDPDNVVPFFVRAPERATGCLSSRAMLRRASRPEPAPRRLAWSPVGCGGGAGGGCLLAVVTAAHHVTVHAPPADGRRRVDAVRNEWRTVCRVSDAFADVLSRRGWRDVDAPAAPRRFARPR